MSFPRYPAYKPSGVEWLGEVPEHWEVQKFRHLFEESSEKIDKEAFGEMLSVSGYRGIELKQYDDENRRRRDEDLAGYRIVRPGQLVVNTMWLNYAGLGFSDLNGHVSPAYRAYWPRTDESTKYLHYLLRSDHYVKGYTRLLTGVRPNSLQMSRDNMMGFPVILPPKIEQLAITTFIDSETVKIDALIAEQQRLIELLQEKRQAVISHAVTKGLNPNAPMKDSGVEWLGEVPEHWDVSRVKTISSFTTSGPRGWSEQINEDGALFVQSGDLNDSLGVDFKGCKRVHASGDAEALRTRLQPGDAVVCITGAKTGNAAVCHELPEDSYINQHLCLIRPVKKIDPGFLGLLLKSHCGQTHFALAQYGLKQGLSLENVRETPVVLPPLQEQIEITSYLNKVLGFMRSLINESHHSVEVLKERRSALISAAVTGQIDVRGLVEAEGNEL